MRFLVKIMHFLPVMKLQSIFFIVIPYFRLSELDIGVNRKLIKMGMGNNICFNAG